MGNKIKSFFQIKFLHEPNLILPNMSWLVIFLACMCGTAIDYVPVLGNSFNPFQTWPVSQILCEEILVVISGPFLISCHPEYLIWYGTLRKKTTRLSGL